MADLIDIGAAPDDGSGDPVRTAFQKLNTKFSNDTLISGGSPVTMDADTAFTVLTTGGTSGVEQITLGAPSDSALRIKTIVIKYTLHADIPTFAKGSEILGLIPMQLALPPGFSNSVVFQFVWSPPAAKWLSLGVFHPPADTVFLNTEICMPNVVDLTSDPGVRGQFWNNSGTLMISEGP